MAEIYKFTPQGGQEERERRLKEREQKETERLLEEAGYGRADPALVFRNLETGPMSHVVALWMRFCNENNLETVPLAEKPTEYDGVGMAAEATLEQVRQALVHHFRQIELLPTVAERQQYWNVNPVIYHYLKIAAE